MNSVKEIPNPTPITIEKGIMTLCKKQMALVETFLSEFCRVNGIEEKELKKQLMIATCPSDNSIMVVNSDDNRDVKFGVRVKIEILERNSFSATLDVFGEYLDQKGEYPKTTELIEKGINYGGSTGDTAVTP